MSPERAARPSQTRAIAPRRRPPRRRSQAEPSRPHALGDGLKLGEFGLSAGGVMAALTGLLACSNGRGGGDYQPHPAIGRGAGNRIAIVGDYAENADLAGRYGAEDSPASLIYLLCAATRDPDPLAYLARAADWAAQAGYPQRVAALRRLTARPVCRY